jgi:hypothetical protein
MILQSKETTKGQNMLTIPVQIEDLDDVIFDLYNASDIVINDNADDYTPPELDDAMWYIENCIDDDGNFRPLTLSVSNGPNYLGKHVVEDYEGAAAWITYDSQGTRRGEPVETSENERNITHILRAQAIAEEWEPYDE